MRRVNPVGALLAAAVVLALTPALTLAQTAGPAAWQNDLTPITPKHWYRDLAAHLLERAGFGGTPAEIDALAKMTPAQAIARLVRYEGTDVSHLPPFDESGSHFPVDSRELLLRQADSDFRPGHTIIIPLVSRRHNLVPSQPRAPCRPRQCVAP